jgi:hypothetical protein
MKILDDVRRTDTKKCTGCGKFESLDKFYTSAKESRCKECVKKKRKQYYDENKEVVKARVTSYRNRNPEKIRDTKLKQAYGVGSAYFDAKLKEQGGVCAGCGQNRKVLWRGKEVAMALDHDHGTKNPRGVLCIKCNRAFGLLEENVQTMLNLIKYTNKYQKVG